MPKTFLAVSNALSTRRIGSIPVAEVKPRDLLDILNPIEARGALETAHRVKQVCGSIFRFAIKLDLAERDITADMRGLIAPRHETHHYRSD